MSTLKVQHKFLYHFFISLIGFLVGPLRFKLGWVPKVSIDLTPPFLSFIPLFHHLSFILPQLPTLGPSN